MSPGGTSEYVGTGRSNLTVSSEWVPIAEIISLGGASPGVLAKRFDWSISGSQSVSPGGISGSVRVLNVSPKEAAVRRWNGWGGTEVRNFDWAAAPKGAPIGEAMTLRWASLSVLGKRFGWSISGFQNLFLKRTSECVEPGRSNLAAFPKEAAVRRWNGAFGHISDGSDWKGVGTGRLAMLLRETPRVIAFITGNTCRLSSVRLLGISSVAERVVVNSVRAVHAIDLYRLKDLVIKLQLREKNKRYKFFCQNCLKK
jgi:hypothetical protein